MLDIWVSSIQLALCIWEAHSLVETILILWYELLLYWFSLVHLRRFSLVHECLGVHTWVTSIHSTLCTWEVYSSIWGINSFYWDHSWLLLLTNGELFDLSRLVVVKDHSVVHPIIWWSFGSHDKLNSFSCVVRHFGYALDTHGFWFCVGEFDLLAWFTTAPQWWYSED